MAAPARTALRASTIASSSRQPLRSFATASSSPAGPSSTASSSRPRIQVALLLSRPPLVSRLNTPFEDAYYAHQFALHRALSTPIDMDFYFRGGSITGRRYQLRQHEYETQTFGAKIAGPAPNVGEITQEDEVVLTPRDKWEKEDAARGEKSLERRPEDEVYIMVKDKGKWVFPTSASEGKELLHVTVSKDWTGEGGKMDGTKMDSWMVTRKPIGFTTDGETRTFYMRSHILAGEPQLKRHKIDWAWLNTSEIQDRLRAQGDEHKWDQVKAILGVASAEVADQA